MADIEDIQKQNKLLKNKVKKLEQDIQERTRNYMLRSKHFAKIIETRSQDIQVNTLTTSQPQATQQSNSTRVYYCKCLDSNQTTYLKNEEQSQQPVTMQNFQSFINKNNTTSGLQQVKQFVKSKFKQFQQLYIKQRLQIKQLKQQNIRANQKYKELKKERKQEKAYFQEAILKSEEENYQFRMEIRKLTCQSRANLHDDTILTTCNQSVAKKIQQTLSDLSFSDIKAKTFNQNGLEQINEEFKKKFTSELYNILNCIPLESSDNCLLFQPQTQSQILAALKQIKGFCQRYQQNLSLIDKKLLTYEEEVRSLLKSMVQGHKLDKDKVLQDIEKYKQLQRVKYFLIKHISQRQGSQQN